MIWFTPIFRPNSPINSKFLSHSDHNQYFSKCFQGNQVSWYFCGSCKKARETTHRNWNLSIPVPRIVGNCFHRGYVATRVFFVWRVTGVDINYCTVLQSVACSETLTLWLGLWLDIIFLCLLHGVSLVSSLGVSRHQFDAKGRRHSKSRYPYRPFLGIQCSIFYSSDFYWEFFVLFFSIRSPKKAFLF